MKRDIISPWNNTITLHRNLFDDYKSHRLRLRWLLYTIFSSSSSSAAVAAAIKSDANGPAFNILYYAIRQQAA